MIDAILSPLTKEYRSIQAATEAVAARLDVFGFGAVARSLTDSEWSDEARRIIMTPPPDPRFTDDLQDEVNALAIRREKLAGKVRLLGAGKREMEVMIAIGIGATCPDWSTALLGRDTEADHDALVARGLVAALPMN